MLSHAAGTDPRAMGDDPAFDITATERPLHSGFGGGVHHCLGHFVARTDMSVALPLLARRMPDIEADGPGEWLPVSGNTGPIRFPLRSASMRESGDNCQCYYGHIAKEAAWMWVCVSCGTG